MFTNPHVSVIMPVYNCEEFVKKSIESILNQSYTNF
jgi:glycosyltransferase involved in cell wall biosynthesis